MKDIFTPDMRLSDMIDMNYTLMQVMSRMGVGLSNAGLKADEACRQCGLDISTFMLICNRPAEKNIDPTRAVKSPFWPVEEIVARGYAALAFHYGEIAPDEAKDNCASGVFAGWSSERTANSWGALQAWAWGASRVMDWIETEPLLDAKHIGVVGHSRGGKTALVAGVEDTRFAMACSNDSGCGGAKLNHMDLPKSESIARITKAFPHWFCKNFAAYAGKDREMDFDQHMFVALMAPRAVAIASATQDDWAGQPGEYACAALASPAWELYGKKGLVSTSFPQPDEARQDGWVSYHLRTGIHNLTLQDWNRYMDFADRLGWRTKPAASLNLHACRYLVALASLRRRLSSSLSPFKSPLPPKRS